MRIPQNKNQKKRILIIAAIVVLFLALIAVSVWSISTGFFSKDELKKTTPENTVNYDRPTTDQQEAGDRAKQEFIKNQDDKITNPDNQATNGAIEMTMTNSSQTGDVYGLRIIISTVDDMGTCNLLLTRTGSQNITQQSDTQSMGTYSICKGFDVDTNALDKGSWQAVITYKNSDGRSGKIEQTIEVKG